MAGNPFPLGKDELLRAYRTMRTIREFEERLHVDFGRGDIPGFVHLYAGEEAAGTGIMMHLHDGDRIASTHRGHGHCIAKGVDVVEMMKEIYGKKGGACNGKGGSMHIADLDKGMMGANGILGAGAPLACGAALAAKYRKQRRGRDQLRRRRRVQPGHVPREPEPRRGVEPAGDLRRREQRLRRVDLARLRRGGGQLRRPRRRLRPARRDRRRHRLLRRLRGGRRGHQARPRGRRPVAARVQDDPLLRPLRGRRRRPTAAGEVEDIRANRDCIKKFAGPGHRRRRRRGGRAGGDRRRGARR